MILPFLPKVLTRRGGSRAAMAAALALAAILALASEGGTLAASKLSVVEQFDCSCKGGSGTCTFTSSTTKISCYKGVGDSCTAECTLSTTSGGGGKVMLKQGLKGGATAPAINGAVKSK